MATAPAVTAEKPIIEPAVPKPKTQVEEREYIVFGHGAYTDGNEPSWIEIGRAKATNANDAEDKVVDALPTEEQGGPFVTIAARYWNPWATRSRSPSSTS